MTKLEMHPEAVAELDAAVGWYEQHGAGLGELLLVEVEECMKRIVATPARFSVYSGAVRRCVLRKFPFAVLFIQEIGQVRVLAVMHLRRRPGYWKKRKKETASF